MTRDSIDKAIADKRDAWTKANPEAKAGTGPFPYRTKGLVRRSGADVPQTLTVTFADGSTETASFSGGQPWQRFAWTRQAKAVSVQLDPERKHYLDAAPLDNARTLESDSSVAQRVGGQFATLMQTLFSFLVSL